MPGQHQKHKIAFSIMFCHENIKKMQSDQVKWGKQEERGQNLLDLPSFFPGFAKVIIKTGINNDMYDTTLKNAILPLKKGPFFDFFLHNTVIQSFQ